MVHSCGFDSTLSLACLDALHVGLFAVKPRHFLLFYCQIQRKYSVCMCVEAKLPHTLCVLVVNVLGWRAMQHVRSYMGETVGEKEGENHEACKR